MPGHGDRPTLDELHSRFKSACVDVRNQEVETTNRGYVHTWTNQVKGFAAQEFVPNDYGIRLAKPGSGMPRLRGPSFELNGNRSIAFREDELINNNNH